MDACEGCGLELAAGPAPGFARGLCGECAIRERIREGERLDARECLRCHKETRHWGRAVWRGDGREYCKGCAKELERIWFIANSCMWCAKLIRGHEARKVPPEGVQQADPYVRSFVVKERSVCMECYEKMTKKPSGVRTRGGGSGGASNWGGGGAPSAVRRECYEKAMKKAFGVGRRENTSTPMPQRQSGVFGVR